MLGLGLACCDLGLVMVLQVTVTVRHQTSAHAYGSDGKVYEFEMSPTTCNCGRMPFQMPADKL